MEEKLKRWKNYGILALTLMIALAGSFKYISSFSTVSGNVNGKEMPICSVETSIARKFGFRDGYELFSFANGADF